MYLIFTQCKSNGTGQICTQWEYNQDIFETTVVTQFDLVCDRKQWLPTIASSYMCGVSIAILKKLLNYFESALKLKNSVVLNTLCGICPNPHKSIELQFSKNYLTTKDPFLVRIQKIQKFRKIYSPDPDSGSGIPEI